ncbi:hypothetical protein O181_063668 [Austropuccinia psidii MF-1]|uniref:Uncharacterized protein n=1 Tax=Austropuccinia psidii MF-1 TaxID=1389203 RepID=A0A9Q3ELQ7_9BASI|nr:hypothetical protein [Austropuccinia psidii MF-1]
MPCKQTPWQPTPGPSGTRWSEDLSHEPSQHNVPPIPGPSPSSKPPGDVPTSLLPSSPACPATPHSVIIIDNTPVGAPCPFSFPLCDPSLHSYPGSLPVPPRTPPPPPPGAKLPSFPQ